jgi:hypothetical protein
MAFVYPYEPVGNLVEDDLLNLVIRQVGNEIG